MSLDVQVKMNGVNHKLGAGHEVWYVETNFIQRCPERSTKALGENQLPAVNKPGVSLPIL